MNEANNHFRFDRPRKESRDIEQWLGFRYTDEEA